MIGAGIDPVAEADGARFRRGYGLDGPYLLYVGRVDVEKGCRTLVDAFLAWRERAAEPVDPGPHGHGRPQAPPPSGHPCARLPARGREARRHRRGDGARHALPARELLLRDPGGVVAGHAGPRDRALPGAPRPRGALGGRTSVRPGPGRLRRRRWSPARRRGAPEGPRRARTGLRRAALPLATHHGPVPRLPVQVFGGIAD